MFRSVRVGSEDAGGGEDSEGGEEVGEVGGAEAIEEEEAVVVVVVVVVEVETFWGRGERSGERLAHRGRRKRDHHRHRPHAFKSDWNKRTEPREPELFRGSRTKRKGTKLPPGKGTQKCRSARRAPIVSIFQHAERVRTLPSLKPADRHRPLSLPDLRSRRADRSVAQDEKENLVVSGGMR